MIFNEHSSMKDIYNSVIILSKSIDQNPNFLIEINEKFNVINEEINKLDSSNTQMQIEIEKLNIEIDKINSKIYDSYTSQSSNNKLINNKESKQDYYYPSQSGNRYYTCINGKQVEITNKLEYKNQIEQVNKLEKVPKLNRIMINGLWTNM